jgi:predicted transcriptional regulator
MSTQPTQQTPNFDLQLQLDGKRLIAVWGGERRYSTFFPRDPERTLRSFIRVWKDRVNGHPATYSYVATRVATLYESITTKQSDVADRGLVDRERVLSLLRDPALLFKVKQVLEQGFHVNGRYRFVLGEDSKKLLLYLINISAKTRWPQSCWLTGDAGLGKSNLAYTVTALMPTGYVKTRSYLTAGGIRYGDQSYKVLFIVEWRHNSEQDLRLIMKEDGGYAFEVAVKDPATGEWTTKVEEVPAKSIITTSAGKLPMPETLRRCWLLSVEEDEELTRQINVRKVEYAAAKIKPVEEEELKILQEAVNLLEDCDVVIPYAEELLKLAPWDRSKLDFLLDLIRVVAYLHQFQRPKRGNVICATAADLYIALRTGWSALLSSLYQLPARLRRCFDILPKYGEGGLTSEEVAAKLGVAQSTARQYLADLINQGYAYEFKQEGSRRKLYCRSVRSAESLNTAENVIQRIDWAKVIEHEKGWKAGEPNGSAEQSNPALDSWRFVVDPIDGRLIELTKLNNNSGSESCSAELTNRLESSPNKPKEEDSRSSSAKVGGSAGFSGSAKCSRCGSKAGVSGYWHPKLKRIEYLCRACAETSEFDLVEACCGSCIHYSSASCLKHPDWAAVMPTARFAETCRDFSPRV